MIKIGFTGDFCPWQRIENKVLKNDNWQELFNSVKPFFDENDFNIMELECPLTIDGDKIAKTGPYLKAHPATAEIINYLNCKLVATANNHFLDYGAAGLKNSYEALNKFNIEWMGSGFNLAEASKPMVKAIGDLKFGFINIAESEWTVTFGDEPGCNPIDLPEIFNQINELKNKVDFIIINVHGGHEHYELPSPRMKKWYRFFIDAGANAVIGHHPHIISGYEYYKEAPIFYGIGNFCFDWENPAHKTWNFGMMVRLIFEKNKQIKFDLEFIEQNSHKEGIFLIESKEHFLNKIQEVNQIISNDKLLKESFNKYVTSMNRTVNTYLQPYLGKILPRIHNIGWLPDLVRKDKKLLLSNLIRCESHKDVLLTYLINNK
jgi:poly-gamma-glutamate capsule biosynthesis protein CapA/YwtB (metallophosphatase superfamily)